MDLPVLWMICFDCHTDDLRTVEHTKRESAVAKAAADYDRRIARLIDSSSIARKNALIGSE